MDRDGIVNSSADPGGSQPLPQCIPLGESDHILVKDVRRLWSACRKSQRQTGETGVVTVRNRLPSRVINRQGSELDPENCRLDRVETRIDAVARTDIPLAPPVFPDFAQRYREPRILGDDNAAVAQRAEIFGWVKAEARDIAERPNCLAAIQRAMALRTILDKTQIICPSDLEECG